VYSLSYFYMMTLFFKYLQSIINQLNFNTMKQVTKEIALTANEFFSTTLTNKDKNKTPLKVRRNGKTQVWKTRPNDFKIPVKYGLHEYGYINQYNCYEWQVED